MDGKIFVLLPVHNRKEITEKFIGCLKDQTYGNYHLILIDDGSTDGTEEMVRRQIEALTVIRGKGNWWWAGALEQGYRWLRSEPGDPNDAVLIINDDTQFDSHFLERGLKLLEAHPRTLLLAQCYGQRSRTVLDKGVHADWRRLTFEPAERPEDLNCLSTRGLFLRAEDFLTVGSFYPRLLPHFISDYEFTIRASRKGFKLMTDPTLQLWVNEETTWSRKFEREPFLPSLRRLFSKKSPSNPVVWTFFVALACPWKYKLLNWYRIWMGTFFLVKSHWIKGKKRKRGLDPSGMEPEK
jgi:GT2 family glycosyltransferase